MGKAMRVGIELVAAIGVGTFMGYWIDQWLDTAPFAMIIMFFFGFAAGFLNIWRAQTGTYHKTGAPGWVDPASTTSKDPLNDPAKGLTTLPKDGQKDPNKNQND
jgi:ATP synthase protein I